jgi:hypothetical protein
MPYVTYTGPAEGLAELEGVLAGAGFSVHRGEPELTTPIVGPVIVRVEIWIEGRGTHRAGAYGLRVKATKAVDVVKRRYQDAWIGLSFEDEDDPVSMS